ncbi:MAG TPA: type 1 glutamine amidotransferase [Mycobacteriales bacterium]|nr:type 1 glutamine amidotransferase [Mycobacteriales bacterium]
MAGTVLIVENSPSDPPGRLGEWLAAAGLEPDVIRPHVGDPLPAGVDGHDALVMLGGEMGVYDDVPWLEPAKALLREAVGTGQPVLAICLGAQLLADALGGRVEIAAAEGPEIGPALVAKRDHAVHDALFGPMPLAPDVLQWHYDSISELPPGSMLLASSTRYTNQAFRVGERAWGLQFHIETTPEMVRGWARSDGLDDDSPAVRRLLSYSDAVHDDLEQVWRPFTERFAKFALAG